MPKERAWEADPKTRKTESKDGGTRDTQLFPDGLGSHGDECCWPLSKPPAPAAREREGFIQGFGGSL